MVASSNFLLNAFVDQYFTIQFAGMQLQIQYGDYDEGKYKSGYIE